MFHRAQRIFGLLLLVALLATLPAGAAPAAAGGRIYFQAAGTGGYSDIFSMNPDGSDVAQLTDSPTSDYSPDISPDGRRVLFVSDRDGYAQIYIMNADGSDEVRLTGGAGMSFDPVWSPDGQRIAFVSTREGTMEVFTMTAAGGNVTNVTEHAEADFNMAPAWSPDGARIAFGSKRQAMSEIFVHTLGQPVGQNNPIRLTDTIGWSGYPDWSPDGARIVFVRFQNFEQDIYVMDANGNNPTPLTDDDFTDYTPDWSPDGTQIAFAGLRGGDNRRRIYLIDPDGSDLSGPISNGSEPSWGVRPAGRAKLTVTQVVAGAPPAASWHFSGPLGAFALPSAGGSRTLIYLDPQTTTVSQITRPGYTTTAACSDGATGGAAVTVTLAGDSAVTCTFTSTFRATPLSVYLPAVRKQ